MKAVRIHETGGPQVLKLEEIVPPDPGPGEVRVVHEAIGVNFIDTYHRSGLYPLPHLPHGLGVEAAGLVDGLGEDVVGFSQGDRVAYVAGSPGSYATCRNVPAKRLVKLPAEVSSEQAAACLLKGISATHRVRPSRSIHSFWHGRALCSSLAALFSTTSPVAKNSS